MLVSRLWQQLEVIIQFSGTTGILLLEVSCPVGMNVPTKEEKKISKYQSLVQQMTQTAISPCTRVYEAKIMK